VCAICEGTFFLLLWELNNLSYIYVEESTNMKNIVGWSVCVCVWKRENYEHTYDKKYAFFIRKIIFFLNFTLLLNTRYIILCKYLEIYFKIIERKIYTVLSDVTKNDTFTINRIIIILYFNDKTWFYIMCASLYK